MTKVDIISGFLGAGKTTLIRRLLREAYRGEKVVLIENEFGEIGIDGGFLKESGIEIKEMNSGCICCSLVGDFTQSLKEVADTYAPERIIIEPSGVGKLSDVVAAVTRAAGAAQFQINSLVTVVDAAKCKMYLRNYGEFFLDQIETAGTIYVSRADVLDAKKVEACVSLLKEKNPDATYITTPAEQLSGEKLLSAMECGDDFFKEAAGEVHSHAHCCGHDHEGHGHDHAHCHGEHDHEHCHGDHGHDHAHDHEEHAHGHCHEDYDHCHEEHDHEHEHCHGDHDHGHCHGEHHGHEGHHHADEVFNTWGRETVKTFTKEGLEDILKALSAEDGSYGQVLRAKGIVEAAGNDGWYYFDMVPGEYEIRTGAADRTGKLCVIGAGIDEAAMERLFLGE